jgi:hypothetical protein
LLSNLVTLNNRTCFIDSDDLQDLTTLFETVRCRVGTLVTLLSSQTLSRPWCCGEVVTAHSKGVPKFVIRESSFEELTEHNFENLETVLDLESSVLVTYHIQSKAIAEAYRALMKLEFVKMFTVPDVNHFTQLSKCILNRTYTVQDAKKIPEPRGAVLLLSDVLDPEATAAAALLEQELAAPMMKHNAKILLSADHPDASEEDVLSWITQSVGVIFVLSRDTFQSAFLLRVHTALTSQGKVVPVNTTSFSSFPTDSFYSTRLPELAAKITDATVTELEGSIRHFFSFISCPLNTAGSKNAISTEIAKVAKRFEESSASVQKKLTLTRAPTSPTSKTPAEASVEAPAKENKVSLAGDYTELIMKV